MDCNAVLELNWLTYGRNEIVLHSGVDWCMHTTDGKIIIL